MSFLAYLLAVTCGAAAWSITENLARRRERQKERAEAEDRRREIQVEVELRGRQADAIHAWLTEGGLSLICRRCGVARSWTTGCPKHPMQTLSFVATPVQVDESPFRQTEWSTVDGYRHERKSGPMLPREMSLAKAKRYCERQDRPCREIPGIALEQLCGACKWNAGPIGPSGTLGPGGPGKEAA